jgi:dihydrofolate reductase
VVVSGGADVARQYLHAGAVQQLRLHLVPVVLGAGTRLFDDQTQLSVRLRPIQIVSAPLATDLTYDVAATG